MRISYLMRLFFFLCINPSFDVTAANVTVVAGGTAILPCSVKEIGPHIVVWMSPKSNPLYLKHKRIIDDHRYTLDQPLPNEWNLHIRKVKKKDTGEYKCIINTPVPVYKMINLYVHEPAKVIHKWSSPKEVKSQEGDTISLMCNATGVPLPEITWWRVPKGGQEKKQRLGMTGEVLVIRNVSRDCDDTYQCVAYNGVTPADSKLFTVFVEFPPEVTLPTARIGQMRNKEVILECESSAYPQSSTYWMFQGEPVVNSHKYKVDIFMQSDKQRVALLILSIRDLEPEDYGKYTCVASNPFGKDQQTMLVYELKATTRSPTPTKTTQSPNDRVKTTQSSSNLRKTTSSTRHKTDPHATDRPRPTDKHGGYEPDNIKGTERIKIVTEHNPFVRPGGRKVSQPHRYNRATKSTYGNLFLVIFISTITSIRVCTRT